MKRRKFFTTIFVVFLMLTIIFSSNAANASEISARSVVIPCNGKPYKITVLAKRKTAIFKHLKVFVEPGDTFTVKTSYETTINNNVDFNLFADLLKMGYSKSIKAGDSIGWSLKNKSSEPKELVILNFYDVVNITQFSNVDHGQCTVSSKRNYNIAVGWGFGLR